MNPFATDRLRSDMATVLASRRNVDGGFGASASRESNTEATALALLAFAAHDNVQVQEARANAVAWLQRNQREDGSWAHSPAAPGGRWVTSIAALALGRTAGDSRAAQRGLSWLIRQDPSSGLSFLARLRHRLFPDQQAVQLDPTIEGWPWVEGTFSWIEPTSYALIALKCLPKLAPRGRAEARVREGERLILDRVCSGGGWNYGNTTVLDHELEPFPDTTALALMALQDTPRSEPVRESLTALDRMLRNTRSGLALALSILCYRLYGVDVTSLRVDLTSRFESTGFLGETRPLALSVMALARVHMWRVPSNG